MKRLLAFLTVFLAPLLTRTVALAAEEEKPTCDADGRFWVYSDYGLNSWIPANWMPAESAQMIAFNENCADSPHSGKQCIRVRIQNWTSPYWCGVAWSRQNPQKPDDAYWGEEPLKGWDLRGAKRVVFWARAPKPCKVQFKAAILGDKPHGDSAKFPIQTDQLTITPDWTEFSIDLEKGMDLSRVVTAFCFVLSRDAQSGKTDPPEFYLDDIHWDFSSPDQKEKPNQPQAAQPAAPPQQEQPKAQEAGEPAAPSQGEEKRRVWVYQDDHLNHWSPANWMPEQAAQIITKLDPKSTDNPKEGERCIRVRIDKWRAPEWCGVAWIYDAKGTGAPYWGEQDAPAMDLTGAKSVVFWARAPQKCQVQFKVAILGDKAFGDSAKYPAETKYLELKQEWTEHRIDVSSLKLSRVVSGFCFVTNKASQTGSGEPVEFFLDSIYWEF